MMKTKIVATAMTLSLAALQAQANFTYEGSLVDNNGAAVSGTVAFQLEVVNPTVTCVLYRETHNVSMTNPDGYFSLIVGTGTGSNSYLLPDVFENNGPNFTCINGGTYTGAAGDSRSLRVFVTVNGGTQEL